MYLLSSEVTHGVGIEEGMYKALGCGVGYQAAEDLKVR